MLDIANAVYRNNTSRQNARVHVKSDSRELAWLWSVAIRSSVRSRTFNFSVSIFSMLWLRGGAFGFGILREVKKGLG